MNKIGLTLLALSILSFTCAQKLSISPYSGIGIGEIKFDQNVILSAMAGTASTASSEFGSEANFFNPAANKNLLFTTFNATFATDVVNFKADNGLDSDRSASYLSEIAIAFPISEKVKFGIGFQPYSAVGYEVSNVYEDTDPIKAIQLEGDGGLNSLHSFASYNLNKEWSFGLRANYLFGNISKIQQIAAENADLIAEYDTETKMRGLMLTPGFYYSKKIGENQYFNVGGTYSTHTSLNTKLDYLNSTYYYNAGGQKTNIDTVQYFSGDSGAHIGSAFSLGLALNKTLKYRFAIEGQIQNKPNYRFEDSFYELKNGYKIAFGSWVIPNFNSYKSYFARMVYRFGAYYQKGTISIDQHDIDQFGITFGFGLPVGRKGFKDPSMLNIAFDLGNRGTTNDGLIRENFANIKIGLNFNDIWFKRRTYN